MVMDRKQERKSLFYYFKVFDRNSNTPAGRLIDITTNGLMLMSESSFKQGDIFNLKMKLPDDIRQNTDIHFDVKCMWSKTADNKDFFDSGFSFVNISDENVEIISSLIRWFKFSVLDGF